MKYYMIFFRMPLEKLKKFTAPAENGAFIIRTDRRIVSMDSRLAEGAVMVCASEPHGQYFGVDKFHPLIMDELERRAGPGGITPHSVYCLCDPAADTAAQIVRLENACLDVLLDTRARATVKEKHDALNILVLVTRYRETLRLGAAMPVFMYARPVRTKKGTDNEK